MKIEKPICKQKKTEQHRLEIPEIHRADYDKAISGKSRKAAVKSFCLECMAWEKEEVRQCTSLECPLYLFRPYKPKPKQASEIAGFSQESTNINEL